jgi:hypothetical protein
MLKNTRDYDGKAIGVFQIKRQNKHGNNNYNIDRSDEHGIH